MIEIEREELKPVRAVLVGLAENRTATDPNPVHELESLASTAGLECAAQIVLTKPADSPRYGVGSGKALEIKTVALECEAEYIVFDFEITPSQQRNWESLTELTCIDRQELIIRIFAARAMTREAALQVELARLEYALPRLSHTYSALSRQRGGRYGTKGSGESQLELDRRSIVDRIARLKVELKQVRQNRSTMRKRREKKPVPSCAIVGYTNVGKSSLLNALTGARVLSEDKLFATLDPTTRRFILPTGRTVLLTDTVGFIRNLPHGLVDAFHATLEEAALATAVICVLDASDPALDVQYETTLRVLREVGAADRPLLLVLNKVDVCEEFTRSRILREYPQAILMSAHTGEGFTAFASSLETLLAGDLRQYLLPLSRPDVLARIHREGLVVSSRYEDDGIVVHARTDGALAASLQEFLDETNT